MIDPESNSIVAAIPVGIRPGPIAAARGPSGLANVQDRSLTRVDPQRRSAVATVSLEDRSPTGLAIGADAVWVAHGPRGELSRVEPQFGQVTRTLGHVAAVRYAVRKRRGLHARRLGRVRRLDAHPHPPRTLRRTGSALTGASPAAVVVGSGSVWVANSGDANVQRFNPATFEEGPLETITVGRRPSGIAYGEGAIWVANLEDDTVTRIDPGTDSTFTIRVGDRPSSVAVGSGAVWVANSGDGTVTRIDAATNEPETTIETRNEPAGIAAGAGFVWVSVQMP